LLPEGNALWLRAAGTLGTVLKLLGREPEIEALAIRVLRVCTATPFDESGAIGVAHLAAQRLGGRRCPIAESLLAMVERLLTPGASPALAGWAHKARGSVALADGRSEALLRCSEAAANDFRRAGDLRTLSMALENLGVAQMDLGALADAERTFAEMVAILNRLRIPSPPTLLVNRGILAYYQGRLGDAEELARTAVLELRRLGSQVLAAITAAYLARTLVAAGDFTRAEAETDEAIGALEGGSVYLPLALATRALVRMSTGRPGPALVASSAAIDALEATGTLMEAAFVRRAHAEALIANGRTEAARAFLQAARDQVLAHADLLPDPELRASYLGQVPDNARLIALAREWCS
jgi:tetratricopeptide (TPR) repeat protein